MQSWREKGEKDGMDGLQEEAEGEGGPSSLVNSRQVIRMVFVPPDSYLCRRPILLGVT